MTINQYQKLAKKVNQRRLFNKVFEYIIYVLVLVGALNAFLLMVMFS